MTAAPHDDGLAPAREEDTIVRLVARRVERRLELRGDAAAAYADWLAAEARLVASEAERSRDERRSRDFAAVVLARRGLERVLDGGLVPRRAPRPVERPAARTLPAALAVEAAAAAGCAPLLDLRVAAGAGRALWEQACDRWVELPAELARGRHVALGVSGDSMEPLLADGDTVLVRLGAAPAPGGVVVARLADDGYVVKQLGRTAGGTIELRSLNPAYPPLRAPARPDTVLGPVVAAWSAAAR